MLREIVAEKVSGLKRRVELETPIVEEIPRPAKILSSVEMAFPPALGMVPVIVRGKAYGETAGLWYRVTFPRALHEPSVVAVGEGRGGVIPTPKAPTITIAPVSISIASAGVPKAASIVVPAVRKGHVPTSLGRFSCGWAISGLTDGLNDLVETLESVLVRINQIIDDAYSAIENIRASLTSLNAKVDDLRAKVNDALASFRDNVQTPVNSALNTLRSNTESAVNEGLAKVIPSLYDAWGIPRNMALTPLHIRNVTSTGFEFQSYGKTTCYYIGVGSLR